MTFILHPTLAADTVFVAKSGGVQILMMDDARYFWVILVPETEAQELHDLDSQIAASLWAIIHNFGRALKQHCNADKINSAAIGNIVPQLHFHIIARHHGDTDWPNPVWGHGQPVPMTNAQKAARLAVAQSWAGNV